MGLFDFVTKTIENTVKLPFVVAKDVITLGGTLSNDEPSTPKVIKSEIEAVNDFIDEE